MSAGKLQDKLDNASKPLWSSRSIKQQIVLMDWNCNTANPPANAPIAILRDILQNVKFKTFINFHYKKKIIIIILKTIFIFLKVGSRCCLQITNKNSRKRL